MYSTDNILFLIYTFTPPFQESDEIAIFAPPPPQKSATAETESKPEENAPTTTVSATDSSTLPDTTAAASILETEQSTASETDTSEPTPDLSNLETPAPEEVPTEAVPSEVSQPNLDPADPFKTPLVTDEGFSQGFDGEEAYYDANEEFQPVSEKSKHNPLSMGPVS